jgi:putative transposase
MNEAILPAQTLGKTAVLRALGLSRASFYRLQASLSPGSEAKPASSNRAGSLPCRVSGRALSSQERQQVRDLLYGEEFVDKTPTQIYAALLDRSLYHCSARTMYRILEDDGPCRTRTRFRKHLSYEKPEILATRPNQLWSWDITRLKGPAACAYFQLYVILDVFSRYVVAWMVAERENQELAAQLIDEAIATQSVEPNTLTVHADRGAAMTSKSVSLLLSDLGVTKTHSRPHVSNDNPYSEAQFKTLKYRPEFPHRFGCIEDARSLCGRLFRWYNGEHYHGGIALLTPATVHYGQAEAVIAQRQQALDAAYRAHPKRFVKRPPTHAELPKAVWINPPEPEKEDTKGSQQGV